MSEAILYKRKATLKSRYGVDFPLQSAEFSEKAKLTCIERFGVENPFQSELVKNKIANTNMSRLGVKNPMQNSVVRRKAQDTCIARYRAETYTRTVEFAEKAKRTNRKKRGVEFPAQSEEVKQKFRQTCASRFGQEHPMKNDSIKKKCMAARTKQYIYDNVFFDSSPELAMFIYLKDKDISFEYQPRSNIKYEYDGKLHDYFPDFNIGGIFFELKGGQFVNPDGTWKCPYDRSLDGLYEAKHLCLLKNGVKILYPSDY